MIRDLLESCVKSVYILLKALIEKGKFSAMYHVFVRTVGCVLCARIASQLLLTSKKCTMRFRKHLEMTVKKYNTIQTNYNFNMN